MKIIELIHTKSSELLNSLETLDALVISEKPTYLNGGFGNIYTYLEINGSISTTPLLIKLLKNTKSQIEGFKNIQHLQNGIIQLKERIPHPDLSFFNFYPGLTAVPLLSFEGLLENETVFGYVMHDLTSLGYQDLENLEEEGEMDQFWYDFNLLDRFRTIYPIINALEALSSVGYVHADLKEDCIFLNLDKKRAALIDFDGGFAPGISEPTTPGSNQPFLAPEILRFINHDKATALKEVSLKSDEWAFGAILFFLLTANEPFSFLMNPVDNVIQDYLSGNTWPNLSNLIETDEVLHFQEDFQFFQTLPEDIRDAFVKTFNKGYNTPQDRTSFKEWLQIFNKYQCQTMIQSVATIPNCITAINQPFELSWRTDNCYQLLVNTETFSNSGKLEYTYSADEHYEIIALGYFGEVETRAVEIVFQAPDPEIIAFQSDKEVILEGQPVVINWNTKHAKSVQILGGVGEVNEKGDKTIYPKETVTLRLSVEGYQKVTFQDLLITVLPIPLFETQMVPCPKCEGEISFQTKTPRPIVEHLPRLPRYNPIQTLPEKLQYPHERKIPSKEINRIKGEIEAQKLINRLKKVYQKIQKRLHKHYGNK